MSSLLKNVSVILLFFLGYKLEAATISGHIKNQKDGAPIPGANIIIAGTNEGASADSLGNYKIENVSPGSYTVKAEAMGFKSEEEKINISSSSVTIEVNFKLEEQAVKLSEVVIKARANQELETSARRTEKEAGNIVNVISAQTIQQSTDRTAADVLQRVSGMSLVRNNEGEGQYVVMRGLAQQYNNTLVDGIKIPSPESKDRFVPLDIFPSELFERIEVVKSLTSDIAGDAIGGSTDLLLREAPNKFIFSFSAGTGTTSGLIGQSFSSFDKSTVNDLDPERMHGTVSADDPTTQIKPRYNPTPADFTTANMVFANKPTPPNGLFSGIIGDRFLGGALGIIAAGSYRNTFDLVNTDFYSVGSNINKIDAEGHLIPYPSNYDKQEYYINRIRSGGLVKADYIAGLEHQLTATFMYVRQEEDQTRHGLDIIIDGSRGAADLTYTHRSAVRTQEIKSISLNGEHFTHSAFQLDWTLNYTDAVQDRPDEAEYSTLQNYDAYGNLEPYQGLGDITHSWRKNDDNQYLGKLDAAYHFDSDGKNTLKAGIVSQKLNRANYEDDYKLNPSVINGHTQEFTSIDSAQVTVFGYGTTSGSTVYGYQNYKASELLYASYLEDAMVFGKLQILGGVRWEEAQDKYLTMASPTIAEHQSNVKMVNLLPGIHFRYAFSSEHIVHLSITESMSRPSYFDLVPAVDRSDESESTGNPNLRPATSTNFDLRYEFYPNPADVFSLGVYYKKILKPIEDQFQSVGVVLVTSKVNGDPATVYGFEAVAAKHFGDFGISANYSYVYSNETSTKQVTIEDAAGDLTQTYHQESRPLESQSPQIANVKLSYENKNWGTDMSFSYNYTGRSLVAIARLDGYDTYEEARSEFDFSTDQDLLYNFSLNLRLVNMFNEPVVTDVASGEYVKHDPITILKDLNKMRGSIGISYKF
jgi:TonB-dependent receptor